MSTLPRHVLPDLAGRALADVRDDLDGPNGDDPGRETREALRRWHKGGSGDKRLRGMWLTRGSDYRERERDAIPESN